MLIPKEVLNSGIEKVCDKESLRYALGGVLLERDSSDPGLAYAAATDGKALIVLRWRDDDRAEYPTIDGCSAVDQPDEPIRAIVGADTWKTLAKMPPKRHPREILTQLAVDERRSQGEKLVVGTTTGDESTVRTVRQLDGRFPEWRNVLDIYHEHASPNWLRVDPQYLATIATIMQKATAQDKTAIESYGIAEPIVLAADGETVSGIGLIMPFTGDHSTPVFWSDIKNRFAEKTQAIVGAS